MNTDGLREHQARNMATLIAALEKHGAALDASETGTGKTYTAIAVARHFNVAPLVVCPKIVRPAWMRVAQQLGGHCIAINYEKLRTGNTPFVRRELVRYHGSPYSDKKKPIYRFHWNKEECPPFIIFDECHYMRKETTLNAKLGTAARRDRIPSLWLSATAAENPLHMGALGYALGLHDWKSFRKFCMLYGARRREGLQTLEFFGNRTKLQALHSLIFPDRGVRTLRSEVTDFPESQITADLFEVDNPQWVDRLYAEMEEQLSRLHEKMEEDADLEHPLTLMLRERQQIELLKVPVFAELIHDAIEEGLYPVAFLNFRESVAALVEKLKRPDIGVIQGGQTERERNETIDGFSSGRIRGVVANLSAGGVGVSLHDTSGDRPRVSFISPSFSALELVQALGRIWRDGGHKTLQRIVLCDGTIETRIYQKLKNKLSNLSLINDGDLNPLIP